jgi:ATP-dependent exoDNAse (exonuclease V) beta subunit
MPLYRVSANLRTVALSSEESKADIFSEHQNAVRILTVHNAKGMEFPAVFLLNAEDGRVVLRDEILYRKTSQQEVPYRFVLKREAEEESRQLFKRSLEEEEERVLYVALTRARQYLFVSGVKNKRGSDSGLWLNMLRKYETAFPPLPASAASSAKEEKTVAPQKKADKEIFAAEREYAALTSYTREKEREYYRYERTVAGDIAHKLLCDLSEGRIIPGKEAYEKRVRFYLGKSGLQEIREIENVLMGVYENIEKNPQLAEVVKERPEGSAFSELPFIIEAEKDRVYAGAVDRIILEGKDACRIYDYKLEGGHPQRHKQQMSLYEKAARKIFPGRPVVKKFVVFLKSGTLHEI